MASYSGNILRLKAPQDTRLNPGRPDESHDEPSGPEAVPPTRAAEISVSADMGTEYAGLTLEDGVPLAVVAGQPGLGWNAPNLASQPVGNGATPAGYAPNWTQGDPHNPNVDTSYASAARGAIYGSTATGNTSSVHAAGDDTAPYKHANPVGVAGSSFLERLIDFPKQMWAEPSGAGADKFIGGTNSYASSNPEGDNYTDRYGARAHFGFESEYFIHTPMFQDKPAQTYEHRTTPTTARDPLVGGAYANTPILGQLAANTWLSELGTAPATTPAGYGVPVDGGM